MTHDKPTLSVVMITYNEAENLAKSLASVHFADEIIVVDRHSEDNTVAIAREHGAKVVSQDWLGFGPQKNSAIDHATGEWILSLDADEVISPDTHTLIMKAMTHTKHDAYYLPRRTYFLGRWILHGDWYPDWQLRLFKRGVTRFADVQIHERVKETALTGYLKQAFIDHYSFRDINAYLAKLTSYTTIEAKARREESANLATMLFKPGYVFLRDYIWRRGFLDGLPGFIIAVLSALSVFVTHAKIFELQRKK